MLDLAAFAPTQGVFSNQDIWAVILQVLFGAIKPFAENTDPDIRRLPERLRPILEPPATSRIEFQTRIASARKILHPALKAAWEAVSLESPRVGPIEPHCGLVAAELVLQVVLFAEFELERLYRRNTPLAQAEQQENLHEQLSRQLWRVRELYRRVLACGVSPDQLCELAAEKIQDGLRRAIHSDKFTNMAFGQRRSYVLRGLIGFFHRGMWRPGSYFKGLDTLAGGKNGVYGVVSLFDRQRGDASPERPAKISERIEQIPCREARSETDELLERDIRRATPREIQTYADMAGLQPAQRRALDEAIGCVEYHALHTCEIGVQLPCTRTISEQQVREVRKAFDSLGPNLARERARICSSCDFGHLFDLEYADLSRWHAAVGEIGDAFYTNASRLRKVLAPVVSLIGEFYPVPPLDPTLINGLIWKILNRPQAEPRRRKATRRSRR